MKIVLTNDDGIGEPGLRALEALCATLVQEVVVVAPATPQSGISHRLTEGGPIRVDELDSTHFAVHGTPADCARLALRELTPDADWLISGINAGANLGMDVYVSGTVAAAREATILGTPAFAISQYLRRFSSIDWLACARRARPALERALAEAPAPGSFWNANLPHPADETTACSIVECALDSNPGGLRFERSAEGFTWDGDYHGRPRSPGHDIDVCFGGSIAFTLLHLSTRPAR